MIICIKIVLVCFFFSLRQVEAITRELELSNDTLEKVMACLLEELNKGLKKATHPTADVKQYITYVRDVPDGSGKLPHLKLTRNSCEIVHFAESIIYIT